MSEVDPANLTTVAQARGGLVIRVLVDGPEVLLQGDDCVGALLLAKLPDKVERMGDQEESRAMGWYMSCSG